MPFYFYLRVVGAFCARQIKMPMTHLQFLSFMEKFQSLSDYAYASSKTEVLRQKY